MQIFKRIFFILALSFLATSAFSERFRFSFKTGEKYSVKTTTAENIYIDGEFCNQTQIIDVANVSIPYADKTWARHEVTYETDFASIRSMREEPIRQQETSKTVFGKNILGQYDIAKNFALPTKRDLPVFPDKSLHPGDSWEEETVEIHDFSTFFPGSDFISIPSLSQYRYLGQVSIGGKILHEIVVKSRFDQKYERTIKRTSRADSLKHITGESYMTLYWNSQKGRVEFCNEEFAMRLDSERGHVFDFKGYSESERVGSEVSRTSNFKLPIDYVKDSKREIPFVDANSPNRTQKNADAQLIRSALDGANLQKVNVKEVSEGVMITLENIQFQSDSDILTDREKEKVRKLAKILKNYNNRLLISGHTALAGTEKGRKTLSKQRADSVANYLVQLGVRSSAQIVTEGRGAEQPIASNESLDGMAKNRRVEIVLIYD